MLSKVIRYIKCYLMLSKHIHGVILIFFPSFTGLGDSDFYVFNYLASYPYVKNMG